MLQSFILAFESLGVLVNGHGLGFYSETISDTELELASSQGPSLPPQETRL